MLITKRVLREEEEPQGIVHTEQSEHEDESDLWEWDSGSGWVH